MTVLVTGAGGFIGGHLVASLVGAGVPVRAFDAKPLQHWHQLHPQAENLVGDCSLLEVAREATSGMDRVYNLSADMGGMGFISVNKAACMMTVLTSTHLLKAALDNGVDRFFYASSACVYPREFERAHDVVPLKESDAYPADPEDGYGWEKLFSERMAIQYREDWGLETRVARFHNMYGPYGTWDGGREKAPAALARKIAAVALGASDEVEIWGDGKQTRSFTYVDDCVHGILDITDGDFPGPVNVGSSELVSVDELVDMLEDIAGVKVVRRYNPAGPQGVRGRNSDNTLFRQTYGWEPTIPLRVGLEFTYRWIYDRLRERLAGVRASSVSSSA
jgi:GDP-D-mannose 3', 5'-epimerase